jgi:5-formyltetrahydrofolate cyclo-ligase
MNARDAARDALRNRLRERRRGVGAAERIAAAEALPARLARLRAYAAAGRIGGYWAIDGELPLAAVVADLRARGSDYCLPLIGADRRLRFAAWRAGDALATNRHGIPEPVVASAQRLDADALDVVLVPLLGFTRAGDRLGFGGGYYDRTFAFLRDRSRPARPLLVGVGYAIQELPEFAATPRDVALDFVATERELIPCRPEVP